MHGTSRLPFAIDPSGPPNDIWRGTFSREAPKTKDLPTRTKPRKITKKKRKRKEGDRETTRVSSFLRSERPDRIRFEESAHARKRGFTLRDERFSRNQTPDRRRGRGRGEGGGREGAMARSSRVSARESAIRVSFGRVRAPTCNPLNCPAKPP
jgi:hypothetical protein